MPSPSGVEMCSQIFSLSRVRTSLPHASGHSDHGAQSPQQVHGSVLHSM